MKKKKKRKQWGRRGEGTACISAPNDGKHSIKIVDVARAEQKGQILNNDRSSTPWTSTLDSVKGITRHTQ